MESQGGAAYASEQTVASGAIDTQTCPEHSRQSGRVHFGSSAKSHLFAVSRRAGEYFGLDKLTILLKNYNIIYILCSIDCKGEIISLPGY